MIKIVAMMMIIVITTIFIVITVMKIIIKTKQIKSLNKEKIIIKDMLKKIDENISIDKIFF